MKSDEEKLNNEKKDKQKKYWSEHSKRYTKRRKLKQAVANFCSRLQLQRCTNLDKGTLANINVRMQGVLCRPYRWTDKDMARAMTSLKNLETKYLKRPYTNLDPKELQLQNTMQTLLSDNNLNLQSQINVVYNLLQELVEQQYLQGAEKIEPSPTNALLLLTQNLKYNMPNWFHKELLNLLYNQYKGKDFNEFMKQIRNELQKKRIKENAKTLNTTNDEEE
ncbi:MAG: hypothetical protein MJ032_00750 [Acidaminococcaceae bacterium]|nr:hypothetical protein [Acidaminococcaceae bacterium]